MSKKKYVDVLGLRTGSTPEVVATFSTRPLANWHIKNTLEGKGYDRFLLRTASKKGSEFVTDVIAEDKGTYVKTVASMGITDLETVTTENTLGTLLGFVLSGDLKAKNGVGKLEMVEGEQEDEGGNLVKSLVTITGEKDVVEISKIKNKLSTELLDAFVGEDDPVEDDSEEQEDEVEDDLEEEEVVEEDSEDDEDEVEDDEVEELEENEEEEIEELEEEDDEVEELEEDEDEEEEEEESEEDDEDDIEELTDEELAELEDLEELEDL